MNNQCALHRMGYEQDAAARCAKHLQIPLSCVGESFAFRGMHDLKHIRSRCAENSVPLNNVLCRNMPANTWRVVRNIMQTSGRHWARRTRTTCAPTLLRNKKESTRERVVYTCSSREPPLHDGPTQRRAPMATTRYSNNIGAKSDCRWEGTLCVIEGRRMTRKSRRQSAKHEGSVKKGYFGC